MTIHSFRHILFFLVLLPLSMKGRIMNQSIDSLCIQWILQGNECILKGKYDEAERLIESVEKAETNTDFSLQTRYYRLNLAFFRASDKYHHAQYVQARTIAYSGLQYYENSVAKPQDRVHLLKVIGDSYLAEGNTEQAYLVFRSIYDYAEQQGLDEIRGESLCWMAKVKRKEGDFNQALASFKSSYQILYGLKSSYTRYAASGIKSLYEYDLYNEAESAYWAEKEMEAMCFLKENNLKENRFGYYSFVTLANLKKDAYKVFKSGQQQEAIDMVSAWIDGAEKESSQDSILIADAYWLRGAMEYQASMPTATLKDMKQALVYINHHNAENRDLLYRVWEHIASALAFRDLYDQAF